MVKAHDFEEILRAGRWFGGLARDFQGALLDAAAVRKLGKEERLFARGDAPNGLYGLVQGTIRVAGTSSGGVEVLLALVEPPMWFGEVSMLDGSPRTHDAVSGDESTLVHVPQALLEAILAREPRHWRDVAVLAATRLRIMYSMAEDAGQPIAVRLARRLVLSAERYGDWHARSSRTVGVRQEQLAAMLSSSRQTVNQLLKRLEADGAIRLSYGQVEILDLDALRDAARPQG